MRHQNQFTNLSREKHRLERIFRKSHPTFQNSLDSLSENLNDFYGQGIRNLRGELEGISKDHAIPVANDSIRCFHLFSQFEIFSCDTFKQIIRSLSSKSCSVDLVPSHLLKNHLHKAKNLLFSGNFTKRLIHWKCHVHDPFSHFGIGKENSAFTIR